MSELPKRFEDLLIRPLIGHLATVRPDGNPAVTPMWYAWDGELLRFSHTTGRAKLRNIAHNPHISLSANDPEKPHRYLQTRAVVVSVALDHDGAFYRKLRRRYDWPSRRRPSRRPIGLSSPRDRWRTPHRTSDRRRVDPMIAARAHPPPAATAAELPDTPTRRRHALSLSPRDVVWALAQPGTS